MKLLTTLTLGLLTSSALFAQTTMCFKENHKSMTTIESTALDGGLCSSSKTVQDMKKEGWNVDDIKIENTADGKNYIYIFKKDSVNISTMDTKKLEEQIMLRLEERKKQEIEIKKTEIKQRMSRDGKTLYINKCQSCHGEKGEIEAYGASRALNSLNLDDMTLAIRDYTLGEYNRGKAFIMQPYANILREKDVKNIYSYIKTLKPKETNKEEAK